MAQEVTQVLSGPLTPVVSGSRIRVSVNVLNGTTQALPWIFPGEIRCRILSGSTSEVHSSLIAAGSLEPAATEVQPGGFIRQDYWLTLPDHLEGRVAVELLELRANPLAMEVRPVVAEPEPKERRPFLSLIKKGEPESEPDNFEPGRFFKEHFSGYEPIYFIAGTESPNAKFQISFKYQLLNKDGALAQRAPMLTGLHVGYTQTSLWDWNEVSAPFLDSSYKPELLYSWERVLGGQPDGSCRLDLQTGFQHESNGKAGDDSRSLNIAYVRPTLMLGRVDGFQFTLGPRAWFYVGDLSDNPDIDRFRGYADLKVSAGWQRGLMLSALGRLGDEWDRGSLQLDLTYPMMSLLSGSFSVYLHAQYFTGYGESLLLYNERSEAFRVGFSLYR